MPHRHFSPPSQTAVSPGDGCLSIFLLTPLAVLVVGALMALLLAGGAEMPVLAQALYLPGTSSDPPTAPPGLAAVFTPEVDAWGAELLRWAAEAGLDPNMLATVMQIESCGDPLALSRSGAMGLFQVMPYHFTPEDDPFDPDTNALRGSQYLVRSIATSGGDARLAFAGYNGGIGVIGWLESDWSAETQRYAYWGSGIYAEASAGLETSLRLGEWLQAGGASLCRQAAERLGLDP